MRYRQLGNSGLTVSVVGLGCNSFGRRIGLEETRSVVDAALESGVTLLDTADSYGESEIFLGKILTGRRDEVVLATKFGSVTDVPQSGTHWGVKGSRRYIRKAIESSLTRLGTDRVDLFQMHFPDRGTPIEETLSTLDDLVHEGKALYVGCSNFTAWQIADADWTARTKGYQHFVSAQNHYNLIERDAEAELLPACEHLGLGFLPYFPLARGMLTGKYRRDAPPPKGARLADPARAGFLTEDHFDRLAVLEDYAAERGISLLDVAIGGLAAQPAVASVIAGATQAHQVHANAHAGDWEPSPDDLAELARVGSSTTG